MLTSFSLRSTLALASILLASASAVAQIGSSSGYDHYSLTAFCNGGLDHVEKQTNALGFYEDYPGVGAYLGYSSSSGIANVYRSWSDARDYIGGLRQITWLDANSISQDVAVESSADAFDEKFVSFTLTQRSKVHLTYYREGFLDTLGGDLDGARNATFESLFEFNSSNGESLYRLHQSYNAQLLEVNSSLGYSNESDFLLDPGTYTTYTSNHGTSFALNGAYGWSFASVSVSLDIQAVPEPATFAVLGCSLVLVARARRRTTRQTLDLRHKS